MFRLIGSLLVFLMLAALAVPALAAGPSGPDLSVILTTYTFQNKDGTWAGETGPFLNALGKNAVDVGKDLPYCDKAVTGTLEGHKVLVITTGTTKIPASECAMNLVMSSYIKQAKEIILTGISGFSPRVGGYLDSVGMPVPGAPTMIGDVCVAPIVVNELAFASAKRGTYWPLNWPNPRADVGHGSMELAKAIYDAAKNVTWPALPDAPKANVLKYFGGNEKVLRPPKAWFGNCTELTSDIFWHSDLDDQYARDWITGPLNEAFNTNLKPGDVLVSTAMETIGIFKAVESYNQVTGSSVPIALVRSSSNYDQPWADASGGEAVGPAESIDAGMTSGGGDAFGALTEYLLVTQYLKESK